MKNFYDYGLPDPIIYALKEMSFEKPTPIQVASIPLALEGHDIMASAQTGTGKTASFVIPIAVRLMECQDAAAMILTPSRELAFQVHKVVQDICHRINDLNPTLIIGGTNISRQTKRLKKKPRIIVGTPGRINDHLLRGTLKTKNIKFLVLDETDRMLDMGFLPQIDKIVHRLPHNRQTMMFSATLPKKILQISKKYLNNPKHISIGNRKKVPDKLKQEVIHTSQEQKYDHLLKELGHREGSILIFARTRRSTDALARKLKRDHFNANAIHGNLRQGKRQKVMADFRNQGLQILVATDIASRGLDVPHIGHVINYDLPDCPEDFIHRIGRTARAGAKGQALCLISPKDRRKWRSIESIMKR